MLHDQALSAVQTRRSDGPPLVLLSSNSAWNLWNFRIDLIRALQQAGYRVAAAVPDDPYCRQLEGAGVECLPLAGMDASGISPARDARLLASYVAIFRAARPLAFLGFTAKPNVYGSIAARITGVAAINSLTGLGTAFIHGTALEKLVGALYRIALSRSAAVFFHNDDDRQLFVARKLVDPHVAKVIAGSGICLDKYRTAPFPDEAGPTFLFVGRLLLEKGVGEFAEAARYVKDRQPQARFRIVGSFASDQRAVSKDDMAAWEADGRLDYLGSCDDIRPHIAASDCVVLPSWREGLPRVLLEAAAMGRPSVASDVPGCRHVVVDGETGLLCAVRSPASLGEALLEMIRIGPSGRAAMGAKARARAEEHFEVSRVSAEYLDRLAAIAATGRARSWF